MNSSENPALLLVCQRPAAINCLLKRVEGGEKAVGANAPRVGARPSSLVRSTPRSPTPLWAESPLLVRANKLLHSVFYKVVGNQSAEGGCALLKDSIRAPGRSLAVKFVSMYK